MSKQLELVLAPKIEGDIARDLQPGQEFKLNPDSPRWLRLTKSTLNPESERMTIDVTILTDGVRVKPEIPTQISLPQKAQVYLKTSA